MMINFNIVIQQNCFSVCSFRLLPSDGLYIKSQFAVEWKIKTKRKHRKKKEKKHTALNRRLERKHKSWDGSQQQGKFP